MPAAIGLRHPASASCLGRHSRLAGRCPNNSSLLPPLAAVVVVALWAFSAENLFYIFGIAERLRAFRYPIFTGEDRVPQRRAFAESGAANAACRYDPSGENAFGALRRARQTRKLKNSSAIDVQSAAEHILNRLARWKAHFLRVPTVRFVWTSP